MPLRNVETASLDAIKLDLAAECGKVSLPNWRRFGSASPDLPGIYLIRIFRTNYTLPLGAGGHDAINLTLEPDGQITERLIHWGIQMGRFMIRDLLMKF